MNLKLIIYKSLQENANGYYERAKKAREKIARLLKEIEKTNQELETRSSKPETESPKLATQREWFEKFHWFKTSTSKLVIGGRNAKQNELLLSKHMENNDLLFHAEVQSPMTVLKDGVNATDADKQETAQFCASYSRAWKMGYPTMNVYCARKEQLAFASSGEYLAHGAVGIKGMKEWFKNVTLGLRIGILDGKIVAYPIDSPVKIEHAVQILPGQKKKASEIAKKLGVTKDKVDPLMPGDG